MKIIIILIGLFLSVNLFCQFTLFDTTTVTQQVLELTAPQRSAVLNGYAGAKSPYGIASSNGIDLQLVKTLYKLLKQVNDVADRFMGGGTPPSTYNALRNAIDTYFDDSVLNPSHTDAILRKKIKYSRKASDRELLSDAELWDHYKSFF
jgi:hypothetical protein